MSALLAVATALLLVSVSLAQITAEAPAKRSLARSVAILTEINAFLDDNREALQRESEASSGGEVDVAGFPVEVRLAADDVQSGEEHALRAAILEQAADRVYENGLSAFRDDGNGTALSLSKRGAVEQWIRLSRPEPHDMFVVSTVVLGGITLALALVAVLISPLHRGLARVGLAVVAGAGSVVIASVLLMFLLEVGSNGLEYLAREYASLWQEALWAPLRNGIIFSGAGLALFGLGFLVMPRRA